MGRVRTDKKPAPEGTIVAKTRYLPPSDERLVM
jgi:hypothetical protein